MLGAASQTLFSFLSSVEQLVHLLSQNSVFHLALPVVLVGFPTKIIQKHDLLFNLVLVKFGFLLGGINVLSSPDVVQITLTLHLVILYAHV